MKRSWMQRLQWNRGEEIGDYDSTQGKFKTERKDDYSAAAEMNIGLNGS